MNKLTAIAIVLALSLPNSSRAAVLPIVFPVQGGGTYTDDFNVTAGAGRIHHGIDIHADKMTPVLAAQGGCVRYLTETEASYGWLLKISGDDGYTYQYIHLNNDTPGTDDGNGGYSNAFAPGINRNACVSKGQVIAYVGDSGNAESIGSHLHFEIYDPSGTAINPYESLMAAEKKGTFSPTEETARATDINTDRGLVAANSGTPGCVSNSLFRSSTAPAVYYCGADGKRYVFPDEKTYFTWYKDFSTVKTLNPETVAAITIGGNVTYRPGVKMIKIQSDPRVYAVSAGGVLRPIGSSTTAAKLYGSSWAKQINDISEAFFINYKIGDPI